MRCACCGATHGGTSNSIQARDRLYETDGAEHFVLICSQCGAGTTTPHETEEQLARHYPESYYAYGPARTGMFNRLRAVRSRRHYARLVSSHPLRELPREPGRLLEVGCGRGDTAAALIERGWVVDGVEPSANACAVAASRGVRPLCGTLATQRLPPSSYDAVVMAHSLEHIADPKAALRDVAGAMKPGAVIVISVPNFACGQRRWFGSRWFHLDVPRHRTHFTPKALSILITEVGLTNVRLSTRTTAIGFLGSVQYALFGRCVFSSPAAVLVAYSVAALLRPLSLLIARVSGGDVLHAIAQSPPAL